MRRQGHPQRAPFSHTRWVRAACLFVLCLKLGAASALIPYQLGQALAHTTHHRADCPEHKDPEAPADSNEHAHHHAHCLRCVLLVSSLPTLTTTATQPLPSTPYRGVYHELHLREARNPNVGARAPPL